MISENQSSWNSGAEKERYLSDVQNNPIDSSIKDWIENYGRENERSQANWDYRMDYELDVEMKTLLNQTNDLIASSKIEQDTSIFKTHDGIQAIFVTSHYKIKDRLLNSNNDKFLKKNTR
jgi:hypothetical protein